MGKLITLGRTGQSTGQQHQANATHWSDLNDELQRLNQHYDLHFADQPRATRDLQLLALMIEDAEKLTAQVTDAMGAHGDTLHAPSQPGVRTGLDLQQDVRACLDALRTEHQSITHAMHQGGKGIQERTLLAVRIDLIAHRYQRHFAGQRRSTRVLSRLDEMISDLEEQRVIAQQMVRHDANPSLSRQLARIDAMIAMYRAEQQAIIAARRVGDAQTQAGMLGAAANTLMVTYQQHFPHTSQGLGVHVGQRPELLRGLIGDLTTLQQEMQILSHQGLAWPPHHANVTIVTQTLAQWKHHLTTLTEMRSNATPHAVRSALYEEADDVLARYNTLQHQGAADQGLWLDEMRFLCDAMEDILRQLEAFVHLRDPIHEEQTHSKNTHVAGARDALVMLVRAYDRATATTTTTTA